MAYWRSNIPDIGRYKPADYEPLTVKLTCKLGAENAAQRQRRYQSDHPYSFVDRNLWTRHQALRTFSLLKADLSLKSQQ